MPFRAVGSLAGWCGVVLCLASSSLVAASPAGAVAGFGDVAEGRYYTEPVQWSVDNDVADIDGNCFLPDAPVSRGEAAVYIWNMQGQPSAPAHSFVDVTDESQDAAVSWMSHNEVTTGTSPTTFDPGGELTRAHLVTFLWRLAGKPSAPDHPFVDVHASWQQGSVSWASDREITTGTSPTTFSPDSPLTRAHLVTFLYRYQDKPDVTVDPASPECDPDAEPPALPPVEVPVDGSAVTVPAGPGFVADLGSVTVEGAPGVFSEATEVRVTHTEVGVGQHSRYSTTAGQSVLLDFGGVEPATPLTLRYSTDRVGLKAEHVTPVVWDYEIEAWVPTIGDEVTVRDGEIIVKTAAPSSAAVTGTDLNGVTVAAGGFGSAPVQVLGWPNCDTWGVSLGCKVVNAIIPDAVVDFAGSVLEGVVDIAGLAAEEIVEKAREYLPGVMAVIEFAVDEGIEFVEHWLLPALADLFGLRAKPPSCSGLAPDWARDGIDFSETDEDDPRVHLCTESGSGDDLHIKTVNNRNFGFQVTSNDVPPKNFEAQQHPDTSLESVLAHEINRRLVDRLSLDGYQWPLRGASFDIAKFERSDRPESTTQWQITIETAVLDATSMGVHLLRAAADRYPISAIFVAVAECVILYTPIPGIPDVGIEQPKHWTAILRAVAGCLLGIADGSIVSDPSLGIDIGEREAVQLKFLSENLNRAKSVAFIAKHSVTALELGIESRRQPPTLTVQPTETPDDTTPGDTTPGDTTSDDTTPPPTPVAKAVSAGFWHTCAIRTDDTITCWGNNWGGQTDAPSGTFKAVSAGGYYWCAIRTDDTITCRGRNSFGQADAPSGTFKTVSAGGGNTCAVRTDDTITCWGYKWNNDDAPSGTFKAVSAGNRLSCAVRTDDTITCWGSNYFGQADAPSGTFKTVSAGTHHSCAVRTDDTITCWGDKSRGRTDAPSGTFNTVSAGDKHSCAVRTDGTITCWGNNWYGETDAPSGTFKTVSAGFEHSCGLRSYGTITCWGSNWHGQADVP